MEVSFYPMYIVYIILLSALYSLSLSVLFMWLPYCQPCTVYCHTLSAYMYLYCSCEAVFTASFLSWFAHSAWTWSASFFEVECSWVGSYRIWEQGDHFNCPNYQEMTTHIEAAITLGTVRSIVATMLNELQCPCSLTTGNIASVKAIVCTPKRIKMLLTQVSLPTQQLSSEETTRLKALIVEFADVFTLDDSELGCTDLLQHCIDTGDHSPIKQRPYCIPVVRWKEVTQNRE